MALISHYNCSVLILCGLLLYLVAAVDHNTFKTCKQSSFCRRLRGVKLGEANYELNLQELEISDSYVETILVNKYTDVSLKFVLEPLIDSTFRLLVDEVNPLSPRYKVNGALDGEPQVSKLELLDRTEHQVTIKSGRNKVILNSTPFKVEFYQGDNLAAVVNGRGLFKFEHLRTRRDKWESTTDQDNPLLREEPGAWEEDFNSHHDSKPRGPEAVGLDITFPGAQRAYGLPEHGDRFALRTTGRGFKDPYRLYNLDVFEYEVDTNMAIYGAVPVLYAHGSEHTIGVFWHNAAETWVDISNSKDQFDYDTEIKVDVHFMSESGIVDLFVFLGPTPQKAVQQYAKLTGTAPLPQYFALGYHQSRWNYISEDDVRTVIEKFDEFNLPVDVMWLDIEYMDDRKYFTWDPVKFQHPIEMQQNLTATGRKLVVIIDPHIKREKGYFLHEDALANDYYVKNKDGSVYEGWCWPGASSYLDFFDPKVREYYASLYSLENFVGSTKDLYIWNDMNEPSVFNGPEITMPKDLVHYGGWEHRHVHNVYGLYYNMITYEGLLTRSGGKLRPFALSRAHFAGTQRYAAVWTGDNTAEWSHLSASLPMCLSEAMGGISFCGADIGGFFKNPDEELLQRWYQAGVWLPFFRAHSHMDSRRREPYLYSHEVCSRIRTALRQRYAHIPLWYTLFWEHSRTAEPVIRPLMYFYPTDMEVLDIDNQILIGTSVLTRPITEPGVSSVNVYFPGGLSEIWYDVDDFKPYPGVGNVNIPVSLDKVPVYYRGGSINPRKDRPRRASTLTHEDPFTLYVALNDNKYAEGTLYIDDYESFDYKNKKYLYIRFVYKNGVLKSSFIDDGSSFSTKAWLERVVILGAPAGYTKAKITSKKSEVQKLKTTYDSERRSLTIRKPGVSMQEAFTISLQ